MLGMKSSLPNLADRQFAMEMIKHHRMAVKMSEDIILNGRSAKIKMKARQIINTQTAEIAFFQNFLAS